MIADPFKVRAHYLRNSFGLDLLASCFPLGIIIDATDTEGFETLRLIKLIRLVRVQRLSRKLAQLLGGSVALRILFTLARFVLAAHWLGCARY